MQLKIIEQPFVELSTLPYLRTTGFRDFEKCPHSWAMKFLRPDLSETRGVASTIGTAAHLIVELQLRITFNYWLGMVRPDDDDLPELLAAQWLKIPLEEQDALYTYLETMLVLPIKKIIGIERELQIDIDGVGKKIKGTLDFVAEMQDGSLLIIDHKTNRSYEDADYWRADIQPQIYSLAVRRTWPEYDVVRYRLGYINMGLLVACDIDKDQDVYTCARVRDNWRRMLDYNDTGIWPMSAHENCRYCPRYKSCPEHEDAMLRFNHSVTQRMSNTSTGQKLEFCTMIRKLAAGKEEELKAQLHEEIQSAGGKVVHNGIEYSLVPSSQRTLDVNEALKSIQRWLAQETTTKEEAAQMQSMLGDLFTGKVGGYDKVSKQIPTLGAMMSEAIGTKDTGVRLKEKPLLAQAKALSSKGK